MPMHILIFCPYYPPHTGGLENYTKELLHSFGKRDIRITLFTPHLPIHSPIEETEGQNIYIIRFPAFEVVSNYPLPKFWLPSFWKMFLALFKENPDIVIAQTRFFFTSLMALLYAKVKKKPWVNIEHGSAFVELSNPVTTTLAKWYDLTFGKLVLQTSTTNISISRAVQTFIHAFDQRTSPVIYRGLDLAMIDAVRPIANFRTQYPNAIILSYVGRLYKWKGVRNTILAINNLPPEIKKHIIFIIAGDGEDLASLQEIADASTVFLGNASHQEALQLLKSTDIYIHSALPGGGLSTSLLEAMYCGSAIIATKNEGADEVIRDEQNGLLLQESDSALIQEKIIKLYHSKETRALYAKKAKKTIADRFDWKQNAEKYIEFFQTLLK